MTDPDFSSVDSLEKALSLVREGKLEKLLLLPEQFGGDERRENVVYVPVGIGALKAQTDSNVIAPLAAEGKVTRYNAAPQYAGKSFVPISIKIEASDPGHFAVDLAIWGEALKK
jgi:hypothetical protein